MAAYKRPNPFPVKDGSVKTSVIMERGVKRNPGYLNQL